MVHVAMVNGIVHVQGEEEGEGEGREKKGEKGIRERGKELNFVYCWSWACML